jgi:hypothetical protein
LWLFDLLARCFEKLASCCRRLDENMVTWMTLRGLR